MVSRLAGIAMTTLRGDPSRQPELQGAIAKEIEATLHALADKGETVLTVAEWAEQRRYLSRAESPRPGRWRNDAVPFAVEPMEYMSPYCPTQLCVFKAPVQVVKTEIALNVALHALDVAPRRVIIAEPRIDDVKKVSKRVNLALAADCFKGRVSDPKSRDGGLTIQIKEVDGVELHLVNTGSAAAVSGTPAGLLLCDEVDRWDYQLGDEGDPFEILLGRMSAWGPSGKCYVASTPVRMNGRTETLWRRGSQGKWHLPCPHCGEMQPYQTQHDDGRYGLCWEGDPDDPANFNAWYECRACGNRVDEYHKADIFAHGRYVHAHPERLATHASWTMEALSAPIGSVTWKDLAAQLARALRSAKRGDTRALQAYRNLRQAQGWEDLGETVSAEGLENRVEPQWHELPARVRYLTAGVDTHDDRLDVSVYGWGPGMEAWLVAHLLIHGDPMHPDTMRQLDDAILTPSWLREDGGRLRVTSACCDAGGHRTQAVLEYAAKRARQGVVAIRGVTHHGAPVWQPKASQSKRFKTAGRFFLVGRTDSADRIMAMIRTREPGPNYLHVGEGTPAHWFSEMTAQRRVRSVAQTGRRKGQEEWHYEPESIGAPDHAWDCARYALAAMHRLLSRGQKLGKYEAPADAGADTTDAAPTPRPVREPVRTEPEQVDTPVETGHPTGGDTVRRRRPKRRSISAEDWWRAQR